MTGAFRQSGEFASVEAAAADFETSPKIAGDGKARGACGECSGVCRAEQAGLDDDGAFDEVDPGRPERGAELVARSGGRKGDEQGGGDFRF
jgi:hypothetical protein